MIQHTYETYKKINKNAPFRRSILYRNSTHEKPLNLTQKIVSFNSYIKEYLEAYFFEAINDIKSIILTSIYS